MQYRINDLGLIFFIGLSIVCFDTWAQSKIEGKIAVLQILNKSNVKPQEVDYLTMEAQSKVQIKTRGYYHVMTQENIYQLLPPDKTLEDCLGKCEVETGRLLGARLLITGQLLKFGNEKENLRLSLKLHETETGTLISSVTIKGRNVNDIEKKMSQATDFLISDGLKIMHPGVFDSTPTIEQEQATDSDQDESEKQKHLKKEKKSKLNMSVQQTSDVDLKIDETLRDLYEQIRNENMEIEWIKIDGGSFMMGNEKGDDDEKPIHMVTIKDFYMSKTEVTVGQYRSCVDVGVCSKPDSCNWTDHIADKENDPINCVDWIQARTFAKWVGGDLPSEAQWEYASRSRGKEIKYPWTNTVPTCRLANYSGCHGQTTPVCTKIAGNTTQGLCDMGGNVWEWVLDEWHNSYRGAPNDDIGWCSDSTCDHRHSNSRIARGGSCFDHALYLRSTVRGLGSISLRDRGIGFRVSTTSIK